jgi:hypothetical protein
MICNMTVGVKWRTGVETKRKMGVSSDEGPWCAWGMFDQRAPGARGHAKGVD